MAERFRCPDDRIFTGWDFSTGSVKCLAFDMQGNKITEVKFGTDLYRGPVLSNGRLEDRRIYELNLLQLEGQARATTRAIAAQLKELGCLNRWVAGGISATHHTAGRIDRNFNPIRRAICWNDATLVDYHRIGLNNLGGESVARKLLGGPWAIRYSLTHLVKDEDPTYLHPNDWERTFRILPHGSLAAGYLTGNFNVCSVSVAASTGLMNFKKKAWAKGMLRALADPRHRKLVQEQLPEIIDQYDAIGPISDSLAIEAGIDSRKRPLIFPTSDDQQAGLIGGGAVDSGQVAIILGNSAVVNSSAKMAPRTGTLDVMRLNWDPFLLMRCYSNGALFLDKVLKGSADWDALEASASATPAGCQGTAVWPLLEPEPSLEIFRPDPDVEWFGPAPPDAGTRFRASLEAIAYLIALGYREHEQVGQKVTQVTVSGGIARSRTMCRILASVLRRPISVLESDEGPALGAAVTSLAAYETHLRRNRNPEASCSMSEAVAKMVRFKETVQPVPEWEGTYLEGLKQFEQRLREKQIKEKSAV